MAKLTLQKISKTAYFAGIDYHKKFSMITLGDEHGEPFFQDKLWHDDIPRIRQFFKEHKGVKCAIESCRGYEWFLDLLNELNIEVHVCNPSKMKIVCQTAFKNDKIDSFKIMQLLSRNYLPTSYQPTHEERHLRERTRWRAGLVRKSTSIKNSINAVLAKENISVKDPYSKRGRVNLATLKMSQEHRAILQDMFDSLDETIAAQAVQERWLKEHCKPDSRISLLKSIPGIGDISAVSFLAEVGNLDRFNKPKQLASYIGLVPRLSESADKRRMGRITKQGSACLRWLLVQDAWVAIKKSPELKRRYLNISRRRGAQIAIVAIARMLVEIAFHVLRDETPFCESILAKND